MAVLPKVVCVSPGQATNCWSGRTDVLLRVETPSDPGDGRTKVAA
jgi:hypothetical protein